MSSEPSLHTNLERLLGDSRRVHRELQRSRELDLQLLHGDTIPPRLKRIPWPPRILYLQGTVPDPDLRWIAVVGSRRATAAGRRSAFQLGQQLAQSGFGVVSGLARGIDAAALEGTLSARGIAGAFLGNGFPRIYPAENADLAHRIRNTGGFLLTEFPLDAPPRRPHFPRRNRLISALGLAVVVVEATLRSGSLITVGWALEQGREVFVFPGSVDGPTHEGCHRLIQDGAALVTGAEDVITGLTQTHRPSLDPLFVTEGSDPADSPEELVSRTGLPPAIALRGWVRCQEDEAPKSEP